MNAEESPSPSSVAADEPRSAARTAAMAVCIVALLLWVRAGFYSLVGLTATSETGPVPGRGWLSSWVGIAMILCAIGVANTAVTLGLVVKRARDRRAWLAVLVFACLQIGVLTAALVIARTTVPGATPFDAWQQLFLATNLADMFRGPGVLGHVTLALTVGVAVVAATHLRRPRHP